MTNWSRIVVSLVFLATLVLAGVAEASPRYSPDWRIPTPFGHVGYGATGDDWAFLYPADGKIIEYQFFWGPFGVTATDVPPAAVAVVGVLAIVAFASLGYFAARRLHELKRKLKPKA